jgi:predicted Holliday junction resolvase-like endonuclease
MTILFLSLVIIIVIIVILVSAKHIKKGFEARSEVKDQQNTQNLSETEEDVLKKLKDKNLSEKDLKKLDEQIQKKK